VTFDDTAWEEEEIINEDTTFHSFTLLMDPILQTLTSLDSDFNILGAAAKGYQS
jgi:hypothetical protein